MGSFMIRQIPLLSVIMPVYNGEKYLSESIESILGQTLSEFEFIIIDDGSTDTSVDIIQEYAKKDNRIYLVENKVNQGLVASLNKGIELSHGQYIARMDQDDISLPERFETQMNFFILNPDIGILGSSVQIIDKYGKAGEVWNFPETHDLVKWELCFRCPIVHPSVMIQKRLLLKNRYRKEWEIAEDYELWVRMVWKSKITTLPNVLLKLRKHPTNNTSRYSKEQYLLSLKIQEIMISQILDENIPINIIECLNVKKFSDHLSYRKTLELVFKLFRSFYYCESLTVKETRLIKSDTIKKMVLIFIYRFPNIDSVYVLFFLFKVDKFLGLFIILKLIFQKVYSVLKVDEK